MAKRPDWFFKESGKPAARSTNQGTESSGKVMDAGNDVGKARAGKALPETETLTFMTPPDWEKEDFRQALADAVQTTETQAAADRAQSKRKILGRQRVRAQHWNHAPNTHANRRGTSPRVAGRDKWRRIEALTRNKQFLEAYKAAMDQYRRGEEAIFPPGTWHMVQFHAMPVASG